MRLFVETMDAVVVEVSPEGEVKLQGDENWSKPGLQERRAIIYAARSELAELTELLDILDT